MLAEHLPATRLKFRARLADHLQPLRNRIFCYRTVRPMLLQANRFDLATVGCLPGGAGSVQHNCTTVKRRTEQPVSSLAAGRLACRQELPPMKRVDLAVATYSLTERLLTEQMGLFSGVRT